jgi:hypothetical protein
MDSGLRMGEATQNSCFARQATILYNMLIYTTHYLSAAKLNRDGSLKP